MIYFITGGERSGKSRYAQKLALELCSNPIYIATSRIWDKDFQIRVEHHKMERDSRWTNIEEEKYVSQLNLENKTVVIDCVTLWLSNFFADTKNNLQESLNQAKNEFDHLILKKSNLIIISNEIGMGGHALTDVGRKFTELQGWINQYIAEKSDEVILMVSGIPVKIKTL